MKGMKAMGVGVIFGIIFTIVVIILIIAFASDVIPNIFCLGSDAQIQKTITNMQTVVDDIYMRSAGSGDYFTVNIPTNLKICFVNSTDPKPVIYPDQQMSWKPDAVIQKMIKDSEYNVWYHQCSGQSGTTINHLHIEPDHNVCIKPGTKLYLKNVGRWVSIIR